MTTTQVAKQLGTKMGQVVSWVERRALPPANSIDNSGVRYFNQGWLRKAEETVESEWEGPEAREGE